MTSEQPYPLPQSGGSPGSPQGVGALPTQAYTPWIRRLGAGIIDYLPAAIIAGVGEGIALATTTKSCVTDTLGNGYSTSCVSSVSGVAITAWLIAGLLALVYVLWNYGYRQGTTGSSVGKSVLKFKVVGEKTGQPIGFGLSVLRQIAHLVDAAICYIGFLFPLWDAKRQTLADKIMSTVCLPIQ
jgi:uncharacterized RDD family membrane protein YckC